MSTFPTIQAPKVIRNIDRKEIVKAPFENGSSGIRPQQGLTKVDHELSWDSLSNSDYETLRTFKDANAGLFFTFVNPISGVSKNMFFPDSTLDFSITGAFGMSDGKPEWSGTIKIKEA